MSGQNRTNYDDDLIEMKEAYRAAGEPWPAPASEIVAWGIDNGFAKLSRRAQIKLLSRDLSDALRKETFVDAKNRKVRVNHSFRVTSIGPTGEKVQTFLWGDYDSMSPKQVRVSVGHRRGQIAGECRQLKIDVDYWNETNTHDDFIQLNLDFSRDDADRQHHAEYVAAAIDESEIFSQIDE